jgi:hypothetical protein
MSKVTRESKMRIQGKGIALVLLLIGALISGVPAQTIDMQMDDLQDRKKELESEISRLQTEISRNDSLSKIEEARFESLQQRNAQDLLRRAAELDTLQSKLDGAALNLQRERSKQYNLDMRLTNIDAERKAFAKVLVQKAEELEQVVQNTLPWEKEKRLDRVRALRRDLESGNASPEEGFSRLRAIYSDEIRFGDEVALVNGPINRNDGELINAKILRLGNQWMVYMDDEGTRYGVLVRSFEDGALQYTWKEDLNFEERQAVKLAIDVKGARKPPQLVRLPLSLAVQTNQANQVKEASQTKASNQASRAANNKVGQ